MRYRILLELLRCAAERYIHNRTVPGNGYVEVVTGTGRPYAEDLSHDLVLLRTDALFRVVAIRSRSSSGRSFILVAI